MASNLPAPDGIEIQEPPTAGAWGEWNPTEDSVRPVRGKHRVAKQRGGLARSSTVLGVGVIAAVGAGGIATAQDRPQVAISLPALSDLVIGDKAQQDDGGSGAASRAAGERTGIMAQQSVHGADAGEALRNRILQQAESQQDAAAAKARAEAEQAAQQAAAQEAKDKLEAARKAAEEAKTQAEAKAAEEAAEKAAAEKAAAEKAEQARPAAPAGSYSLPTSAYTLTSHYGDSGSMWSSGHHTGLDFAAPTGTPVKAVSGGKITSAGWSGAYGYRIVLELPDGTEIWYCHLSSMSVTSGSVGAGETIGRVGATGNVTGPHLHLEVRKGGSTMDPLAWLNSKGLNV
ncbi:M23 family metallopeptidase [Streptomyces avidinii]|uniref:Murein DD-endopeptidase MepM/ murein hydrolase activator NlpD n=1 Tax=Streptomyces avidinii TaxID=1895 RepID=A0ABS4LHY2_STRAV|nr:M23 family metallopeptidase [Streptomyces avidinii]MBP2041740.1 murein DD-endopeptidase MepM/ murein hydrolase activator NlpD [Streptomyces avidinii]GGZ19954.1 peptidase [Streptomyces avidinii]